MISVQLPKFEITSEEFFTASIAMTTPLEKRKRLQGSFKAFAESISEYRHLASTQCLHELNATSDPFGGAWVKDFKSLYGSFLQNTDALGRQFYDALLVAHDLRICPYCGTREAKTLDHFLARKHFPHLGIAFENLVACCPECNQAKLDAVPDSREKTFFHPYYEEFPVRDWLIAEIRERQPVTVAFDVADGIPEVERIRHQFNELQLARIFSFHATNELMGNSWAIMKLGRMSTDSLLQHLSALADGASRYTWYPWKRALYRALAADEWFCKLGFEMLT